nr:hypothetical protein [uncultured Cohaesibacter sp.]
MTLKSTALDHIQELIAQGVLLKYTPSVPLDSPNEERRCLYITPIVQRVLEGNKVELNWGSEFLTLPKRERFVCNATLRMFIQGEACAIVELGDVSLDDPDWKLLDFPEKVVWEIRFRGANTASAHVRIFGFFIAKDVFLICAIRQKSSLVNNLSYILVVEKIETFANSLQLGDAILSGKSYAPDCIERYYDKCLSNWEKADVWVQKTE